MNKLAVTALAVSMALAVSGCSHKKASTTETTSSSVASTSTTVATSLTTPTTAATPTSVAATTSMSHLTAVRVSAQGTGDQVSFEFDNGVPGYSVKTTTSPIKTGGDAGNVTVSGTTVYEISFATASDVDLSGGLKNYYNGSKDITPTDAKVTTEIKQVSDNEGVLTWAIGTTGRAPLKVSTVSAPPQVVFQLG